MFANRWNVDVLEDAYERWKRDRRAVDGSWGPFFEGFELGAAPALAAADRAAQIGVVYPIDAYRELGHFLARLDPLSEPTTTRPQLELAEFGLSDANLDDT